MNPFVDAPDFDLSDDGLAPPDFPTAELEDDPINPWPADFDPSTAHLEPQCMEAERPSPFEEVPSGHQLGAGISMRGRLRSRYRAWQAIEANKLVLNWIRYG